MYCLTLYGVKLVILRLKNELLIKMTMYVCLYPVEAVFKLWCHSTGVCLPSFNDLFHLIR